LDEERMNISGRHHQYAATAVTLSRIREMTQRSDVSRHSVASH
jgi:hypothetical protein